MDHKSCGVLFIWRQLSCLISSYCALSVLGNKEAEMRHRECLSIETDSEVHSLSLLRCCASLIQLVWKVPLMAMTDLPVWTPQRGLH